jgi:hypothetical protein
MERIAVPGVALIVIRLQRIHKGQAKYAELHNQWHYGWPRPKKRSYGGWTVHFLIDKLTRSLASGHREGTPSTKRIAKAPSIHSLLAEFWALPEFGGWRCML